jgi:hypothetical protein
MGQSEHPPLYGSIPRGFVDGGVWIQAIALCREPVNDMTIIDRVELIHVTGSAKHAVKLLAALKDEYVGQPYSKWEPAGDAA